MRATPIVACLIALAAAAPGCGEDEGVGAETGTTTASAETEVPEGVAEQYATIEEEVAAEGGETTSGPWRIAYIVEPAEGWFQRRGDVLPFRAPAPAETHHIEILPIEASSGRLVPEVPITLEVLDAKRRRVTRKRLSLYYAEFFHYAENFSIPRAGEYTLRATIEPPPFRRHGDEQDEPPLAEGATVEFDGVALERE